MSFYIIYYRYKLLDITHTEWQSNKGVEQFNVPYLVYEWFGGMKMNMEKMIERINQLARKAKIAELTDEEMDERNELRKRYIEVFKGNLQIQLDSIRYVEDEEKR
jgi:uncharacterized protein YnzC (UPF0291/DUF896 family)